MAISNESTYTFRVSTSQLDRLRHIAEREHRTPSQQLRLILERWLAEHDKELQEAA